MMLSLGELTAWHLTGTVCVCVCVVSLSFSLSLCVVYVQMCVEARRGCWVSLSVNTCLTSMRQDFLNQDLGWQPKAPATLLSPTPTVLGLQDFMATHGFCVCVFWDLNSGPHDCTASALSR